MSPRAWNVLRAIVLASPFIVFVFLLITSPPGAGTFAGSLLGKITDPPVLLGIILSGAVGALGYRWPWALGVVSVVFLFGGRVVVGAGGVGGGGGGVGCLGGGGGGVWGIFFGGRRWPGAL